MDFLRSAYSTTVHFKDGDPRTSTITWYKAPTGALPFPDHHYFGSLNWTDRNSGVNDVGEIVGAPRPWSNGATPDGVLGTNFCGDVTDYLGITDFRTTPMPLNSFGQPTCCDSPEHCVEFDAGSNWRYVSVNAVPLVTEQNHYSTPDYLFYPEGAASPEGLVWDPSGVACPGGGLEGSTLIAFPGGDPSGGVFCTPNADATSAEASTWTIPMTSAWHPGETVTISSPATHPPQRRQLAVAGGSSPRGLTWPAATLAGSHLVVALGYRTAAVDPTMPAGWTLAKRLSASFGSVAICYKPNSPSQTVTGNFGGGTFILLIGAEYRFVTTSSPLDKVQAASGAGHSATTGLTAAIAQVHELLTAAFFLDTVTTLTSVPATWTTVTNTTASGFQLWLFERNTLSIATYSCDIGLTASPNWRGAIATFKGA